MFLSSSEARRYGQWEPTSWIDFVGAKTRSKEDRTVLAAGLTRSLVAAKATIASTRTVGNMRESCVYKMIGRGHAGRSTGCSTSRPTRPGSIPGWSS